MFFRSFMRFPEQMRKEATMRAARFLLLPLLAIFLLIGAVPGMATAMTGEALYKQGISLEKKLDLFRAAEKYSQARERFSKEGNAKGVARCREALSRIECVKLTYPLTEEQAREAIRKFKPEVTPARLEEVLREGRLPHLAIGGKIYYFDGFTNALNHLYPDFRRSDEGGALGKVTRLLEAFTPYLYPKATYHANRTLFNPIRYEAEGELTVPRNKLPDKGLFKVWIPLPLVTAAQPEVEILSIYPEKYVAYPIRLEGDIAMAHLEIPLEEIKGDLKIGAKFRFTHYEERFQIDPARIGSYDKKSELYKRYTASRGNIRVTPAIRAKARQIAGKEKNPYLIAKRFYEYIVYNLDYAYTPHGGMEALEIPESVYVHKNGYGDCGAQSMYFAALCRAMGIPARAGGGYQLFPIVERGNNQHFWAQFYLPNYGWIPVDTSVGQLIKYMQGPSEQLKHDFIEYFFTQMDPWRLLIQVDVDVPWIPRPEETPLLAVALQDPAVECAQTELNAGLLVIDRWNFKVRQLKNDMRKEAN